MKNGMSRSIIAKAVRKEKKTVESLHFYVENLQRKKAKIKRVMHPDSKKFEIPDQILKNAAELAAFPLGKHH